MASAIPRSEQGRIGGQTVVEAEVRLCIDVPLAAAQAGRERAKARREPACTLATEWAESVAEETARTLAARMGGGVVQNVLDYHPGANQTRSFQFVIRVPVAAA